MKQILSTLLIVCFSTTLFSQTIVSTEPSNRNMVLEEFTGKDCQYCPDGHKKAQQLLSQYPNRFYVVNIHQGGFATGTPNYRTPYGDALANMALIPGYPAGTVNRQVFEGVPLMAPTNYAYDRGRWASCVAKGIAEPSCLNVAAEGVLDWKARKLTLLVEIYYTGNAVQPINKVNVAMLQSEILGPQSGAGTWYPEMMVGSNYRHQHMLRNFITGQWGMDVTPTTEGSFWSHTFEYDIPKYINDMWVCLENLEFIVYVAENEQKIITGSQAKIENINKCYSVLASAWPSTHGSISNPGETTYEVGDNATYYFTPDVDRAVKDVRIDDVALGIGDVPYYTIENLTKDTKIMVEFKYQPWVGIADVEDASISIEPNPFTNELLVSGTYNKLEIFSVNGQLILTALNQPKINVSHLHTGTYIVKIQNNEQISTFKVVK